MSEIRWLKNTILKSNSTAPALMSLEEAKKARDFHRGFPEYAVTPLISLRALAEEFGIGAVYVKDESHRFGLNAFKVLGGSYALLRFIAKKLGKDGASFLLMCSVRI